MCVQQESKSSTLQTQSKTNLKPKPVLSNNAGFIHQGAASMNVQMSGGTRLMLTLWKALLFISELKREMAHEQSTDSSG